MNKTTFVSGCDANYFPILVEWLHSVKRFDTIKDIDVCILDAGLTSEQIQTLEPQVKKIVNPDWPANIPSHKIRGREYLKGCICRPFINQMFPNYDTYIWMDADTWLQDVRAIDLLLEGAKRNQLAIIPQTDRAYGKSMRLKWLGPFPWKARSFYYSNARKAFGGKIARQLFPFPTINAGIFALSGDAPHWERWQKLAIQALKKGKVFTAEQLTLGMMIYLEGYKAEFLPAWCNWLCEVKPLWDDTKMQFVEPYLPHTPIGIVHMSGVDEMRLDRRVKDNFKTLDNKDIELSYRYPDFDGESS